jgi:hypothetical protein
MEGVLLDALGRQSTSSGSRPPSSHPYLRSPRSHLPSLSLSQLDELVLYLQANAIERSTSKGYATGARHYINFCLSHKLPIDPTPQTLARYIAFSSQFIASGPKYLSGVRHFLKDIYPDFDANRSHPLVTSTIRGSKKVRGDPVKHKLPL